jgi:chromosome segregation ATPase
MKFYQSLFTLCVAVIAVVATEEAEINGNGEMVPPASDCDEVCAARVAEAIGHANQEKEGIWDRVRTLEHDASAKDGDIEYLQGHLRAAQEETESAKRELSSSQAALEENKKSYAESVGAGQKKKASAEAEIKALQAEVAKARKESEEYSTARFFINFELIEKDMVDLLKKYGLKK